MDENKLTQLPMLVLRGRTLFPNVSASFDVSRIKSLTAVGKSIDYNNMIFICSQKDGSKDEFDEQNIFKVGVACRVKKVSQLGGTNMRVFVETLYRAQILEFIDKKDHFAVAVSELFDERGQKRDEELFVEVLKGKVREYSLINNKFPHEILDIITSIDDPVEFANVASHNLPIKDSEKQVILEENLVLNRLKLLSMAIAKLIEFAKLERAISEDVKQSVDKSQREYYLREQLKAVHKELGDDENEVDTLRDKIIAKKMPKEIEEKGLKELNRMSRMNSSSPDYTVLRTYIDLLIELPFNEMSEDESDINKAIDILNADHFGLDKVKERIIEYIAVLKNTKKMSSTILCLVGPPGVGKTSVATSIAHALNRKFVRMSLGGVKDEAEIRGHRKTYVGAMPGRIITGIKNAGVSNPVFLLDEIDKMSMDLRGDPASALLEVLDPEQNSTFRDRYMEIPYDLSNTLFITTANSVETIPAPLLDRMEVISLDGYTEEEKIEIAKRYLVPKRLKMNGLSEKSIAFDDDALKAIVEGYTIEAGVRNLERQIDSVCRKITTEFAKNGKFGKRKVSQSTLKKYLGSPKYLKEDEQNEDMLGAANGLAWTQYGGTTLTVEVAKLKGKGDVILTGKLGDVMKESARIALTYVRSISSEFGINDSDFSENDVHLHVPEGATPKDGPSAGITIATAILSAFSNKKVRGDVAMTGEITLRGNVLPIGGLKEKSLAAFRSGVHNIIIPKLNEKDIEEIPENIRDKINFIPVKSAMEVFKNSLRDM